MKFPSSYSIDVLIGINPLLNEQLSISVLLIITLVKFPVLKPLPYLIIYLF